MMQRISAGPGGTRARWTLTRSARLDALLAKVRPIKACRTSPAAICAVLTGFVAFAPTAWAETPAIRPAAPPKTVTVPLPKPAPQAGAPKAPEPAPPPDVWSESEIADAKRVCQDALKAMTATVVPLPPVKKGRCGAPAPVRLVSIGKTHPVKFVPAPTVSCAMLVPLRRWIDKGLQQRAARYLDTPVTEISVMSSYSCRTRYGRKGAKMSEHAFANALDIGGFRLADGTRVSVLKDWGATRRDIAKAAQAAKQAAAAAAAKPAPAAAPQPAQAWTPSTQKAAKRPGAELPPVRIQRGRRRSPEDQARALARLQLAQPDRTARPTTRERTTRLPRPAEPPRTARTSPDRGLPSALPPLPTRRPLRQAVRNHLKFNQTTPRQPLQAPQSPRVKPLRQFANPPYRLGGPKPPPSSPKARFLRTIHQSACRIFGTTLGPEANEAHRNHFHFDMFPRRNGGYCE